MKFDILKANAILSITANDSNLGNFAKLVMVDCLDELIVFSVPRTQDIALFEFDFHIVSSFI